jgi:glycosyl transferase family 25
MLSPFETLNQHYDKIYVLSVESAEQRREKFRQRFEGLNYEFFYGADKTLFTIKQAEKDHIYSETKTREHHRFSKAMKHGEIACSWSHRMIYEDMLSKNYHQVLIFEDDALPDLQSLELIPAILSELPADWELLMWGWDKNGKPPAGAFFKKTFYQLKHSLGRLKWNPRMIRNLYARPYSAHLRRAGFHDYTYAYALTRSAAEKLVRMQTPIQYIADNLLAHAATNEVLKSFITWPPVFLHDIPAEGEGIRSYIR